MTLLTAVQQACGELALAVPSTIIGNTDLQVMQLLALANREGREFARIPGEWSGWPEQRVEYVFPMVPATGGTSGVYTGDTTINSSVLTNIADTTGILVNYGVSGGSILTGAFVTAVTPTTVTLNTPANATSTAQNFSFGQVFYALPSDLKYFIQATFWDRNFRWQMLGPISPQEWQTIVSGISPVGPRIRFRIMDGQLAVQPPPGPTQTDSLVYEYITKNWCTSAGGVGQQAWLADTDTYLWDDDYLTLGIKWRFLRAKGLDYDEELSTYKTAIEMQMSRSGTNRTLPLNARGFGLRLLNSSNVPDTGYGT